MVGSDGLPHDTHPHPRLWGTFPRVLGRFCREEQLFSLEQAVHKMTGLSAGNFNIADRGEIRAGAYADLVVFDEQAINDTATFEDPAQPAAGIDHVIVKRPGSDGRPASIRATEPGGSFAGNNAKRRRRGYGQG